MNTKKDEYNNWEVKNTKQVRVILSKSEIEAAMGNYHVAVYESLKESGSISKNRVANKNILIRPEKIAY